jgi:hypothetical protein
VNEDTILRDLTRIRQIIKWRQTEEFEGLELLGHPAVVRCAKDPDDPKSLVKSLHGLLKQCKQRLKERERGEKVDRGHSVAFAAGALLRLEGKYDGLQLQEIRQEIVKVWIGKKGGPVGVANFRQKYELPDVLEPFSRELHPFLGEVAANGPPPEPPKPRRSKPTLRGKERQMFKHLEKLERERLAAIPREGKLEISTEAEMVKILRKVNHLARQSLRAVDRTPIGHWNENKSAKDYLKDQLKRVSEKGLSLERIYLVTPDLLELDLEREQLVEFVRKHENKKVKASVLLCPSDEITDMSSQFVEEDRGMLLADSEKDPLAVTGKLKEGKIGEAFLYTREQTDIDNLRRQYQTLRERILARHLDESLRRELGLLS